MSGSNKGFRCTTIDRECQIKERFIEGWTISVIRSVFLEVDVIIKAFENIVTKRLMTVCNGMKGKTKVVKND